MIPNKLLLLYINHFDSINKNISNKECIYLKSETKLQHITKQNKTMELLTPAMIHCLTLFQGFKQTTPCYCYNRREQESSTPQSKAFFNMRLQVFHYRKKQI